MIDQSPTHVASPKDVESLIVVYAADSGPVALLLDVARKLLGNEACTLCAITHSARGERNEWVACKRELGKPVEVFHQDDVTPEVLAAAHRALPAVLARTTSGVELLVGPAEIARCNGTVANLRIALLGAAKTRGLRL